MCPQTLYLALLTLYENNFRGLHWKVQGCGFHVDHERFGGYYDKVGEFMDQTAEALISQGFPPVGIPKALDILNQVEIDAFTIDMEKDYDGDVANIAAHRMFTQLYEQSAALAKNDELPIDIQDLYTEHARYFRVEALYKLARAIPKNVETPPAAEPEPEPAPEPQSGSEEPTGDDNE